MLTSCVPRADLSPGKSHLKEDNEILQEVVTEFTVQASNQAEQLAFLSYTGGSSYFL